MMIDVTNDGLALGLLLFAVACLAAIVTLIVLNCKAGEAVLIALVSLTSSSVGAVAGYITGSNKKEG